MRWLWRHTKVFFFGLQNLLGVHVGSMVRSSLIPRLCMRRKVVWEWGWSLISTKFGILQHHREFTAHTSKRYKRWGYYCQAGYGGNELKKEDKEWKWLVTGRDSGWVWFAAVSHTMCVSLSWQISEYIIQAYKNGMFQKVPLIVLGVCVCAHRVEKAQLLSCGSKTKCLEHLALAGEEETDLTAVLRKREGSEILTMWESYEGWWGAWCSVVQVKPGALDFQEVC